MADEPIRIVDPDPRVEAILDQMDRKVNRPIVGVDGETLLKPLVDDRTLTYAKDGESFSQDPEEFLMAAARMQRDGMTAANIRAELDLPRGLVSDVTLERALAFGKWLLDKGIEEGSQPEESVRVLGYVGADDPAPSTDTVSDALSFGERVRESWRKRRRDRGA